MSTPISPRQPGKWMTWRGVQRELEQASDVALYLIDVGVESPQNFALGDLQLSEETLPENSKLTVSTTISCVGQGGKRAVELYVEDVDPTLPLVRDGVVVLPPSRVAGRQEVELAENGSQTIEFVVPGLALGMRHAELRLVGPDALTVDNTRFVSVMVRSPWLVLVAAPSDVNTSAFVEAIAPYQFRTANRAAYECLVIPTDEITNHSLADFAAVVLLDPTPLPATAWEQLAVYVREGGQLALLLGPHAGDGSSFNTTEAAALMPGRLGRQYRVSGRDVYLAPHSYDHPILRDFRPFASSVPWDEFPIFRYWNLQQLAPQTQIVLRYGNNQPALLERSVGPGTVLTMTTPVTEPERPRGRQAWNELAGLNDWPRFMLVNQMMRYLTQHDAGQYNFDTGQTVVLPNRSDEDPGRYLLFTPDGETQPVQARDDKLTITTTETPGIYRLKGDRDGPVSRGFSVNLPLQASLLERTNKEQLDKLFGADRYQLARDREQIERQQGRQRAGREFFPFLMAVLAVTLILEQLLANRFYRDTETSARMTNWSLQPILDSYSIVAILAAGLLLALWVGPTFRRLSLRRQRTLLVLRVLVILLVILVMLRPTHISTESKTQTAVLLILFDQSLSMQLPAASGSKSRWEAQLQTLRQISPLLKDLGKNLEVKVQPYDATLHPQVWTDGQLQLPAEPEGRETDIGTSLHEAVEQEAGKRLAGVILLGDGTQTAYQPAVEIYDAARELGNRGYPLYTVTYGPAGDAAQSRDVAVENLPEQYTIFVKNELAIRGLLRVRGYVNKEIPVRLEIEDSTGTKQMVGPTPIQADQDNQQVDVNFTYVPQKPGQYKLTLKADEQPGELVTKNNELTAFLTVLEGGLRVLYLEGEPRQEQKFIRWALDTSPDIDLDFQWFPSRLRKDWPVLLGDTIQKGNYDAYILGDLDSAALGADNLKQLAGEVEKGKGLIAIGGYHSFGPGGYRTTPLADVLPIEMDRLARQDFGRPDVQRWHVPGPLQMLPTRSHPVTMLASPADNLRAWQELKPLKGANRWAGAKDVPGIQVLAEAQGAEGEIPLLVAGAIRRGTRAGLCRRFHLAMVATRPEHHASPVLATSHPLARSTR